jgi:hypothetical protein
MAENTQGPIDSNQGGAPKGKKRDAKRENKLKNKQDEANHKARSKRRFLILAGIIALAISLCIYLLRMDGTVGQILDDAWYVLLAKALATGQGYTLINSPSPGIMPLYPPGFPFILSLFFRLSPQFPQNLWLLKSVSIAAMLGVGVATYYYFIRLRDLPHLPALGIATATTLGPGLVFLATSTVMSECVFTLLQLSSILVVEQCVRRQRDDVWKHALIVAGAGLASLAFLTRSVAVALILAVIVYLLKERLLRMTLVFVAGVILFAGPWMLYSRLHSPTAEQKAEQNHGYVVRGYAEQFWDRLAGHAPAGKVSPADLPARIGNNIVGIMTEDLGGMLVTPMFRSLNQGLGERPNAGRSFLSFLLSLLVIAGFVFTLREKVTLAEITFALSLGIIVLWPFPPFRYVLPFLPFVIFHAVMGTRAIRHFARRKSQTSEGQGLPALVGFAVWLIVALNLYTNFDYIGRKFDDSPQRGPLWTRIFAENEPLLQWASQNLPAEGAIAGQNPALAYLYTGRKTVPLDNPAENWERWKAMNVRFVMHTSPVPVADEPAESNYRVIYRSRGSLNLKIIDLGPPSSRPAWEKN